MYYKTGDKVPNVQLELSLLEDYFFSRIRKYFTEETEQNFRKTIKKYFKARDLESLRYHCQYYSDDELRDCVREMSHVFKVKIEELPPPPDRVFWGLVIIITTLSSLLLLLWLSIK